MLNKIAILGCGPAALIAAHTLERDYGISKSEIDILSRDREKSPIGGAQYLHSGECCHDEDGFQLKPSGKISHVHLGEASGYAFKVYRDAEVKTSWDSHDGDIEAWSLELAYRILWNEWVHRIQVEEIDGTNLYSLRDRYNYGVISTIPARHTCYKGHDFPVINSALVPLVPVLGIDNIVIYSGRHQDGWYRVSCIDGHSWAEWLHETAFSHFHSTLPKGTLMGEKPMGTDCDCCREAGIVRMGRFGSWDRRVLLHHIPSHVEKSVCAGLLNLPTEKVA